MNRKEITDIIYDTLFGNTNFPQFDMDSVTPLNSIYGNDDNYSEDDIPTQEVESNKGIIRFGYEGTEFEISVKEVGKLSESNKRFKRESLITESKITYNNTSVDDEIIENNDGTYNFLFATDDDVAEYLFNKSLEAKEKYGNFEDFLMDSNYLDFYVDYDSVEKEIISAVIVIDGVEYPIGISTNDKLVLADICENALEKDGWNESDRRDDKYAYSDNFDYENPHTYVDRNYQRFYDEPEY